LPTEEVPLWTEANPRAWNAKATQQLRKLGFAMSKADSSVFIRKTRLGPVSILLYVDDLVITGADLKEITRVKRQLAASFEMKDLGDLHYFLGIEVIHTPGRHTDESMALCIEYALQSSVWPNVSPSRRFWIEP
jgi:hypothetical protein